MGEDLGGHVPAVAASHLRPVDLVANLDLREGFRSPVCHQDGCLATLAITARVGASAVWIDRPIEGQEGPRDAVDHRAGFDLDALDPPELRRVERASRDLEELLTGHGGPA
jgi:hypothetical protein